MMPQPRERTDLQGSWSYEVIFAAIKAVRRMVGNFETLQELLFFFLPLSMAA
jgi:hypothetical protein